MGDLVPLGCRANQGTLQVPAPALSRLPINSEQGQSDVAAAIFIALKAIGVRIGLSRGDRSGRGGFAENRWKEDRGSSGQLQVNQLPDACLCPSSFPFIIHPPHQEPETKGRTHMSILQQAGKSRKQRTDAAPHMFHHEEQVAREILHVPQKEEEEEEEEEENTPSKRSPDAIRQVGSLELGRSEEPLPTPLHDSYLFKHIS
ncbi:unnamed protein product [Pleuronectes platessa]|uniref:Uncharacterized protein n=1 Tax=Pleuronectes platessa TaxID=8262 RepID=A0A9N7UQM2_PLEPL|nr:unnamed protein product [Pleuronectes platessa]